MIYLSFVLVVHLHFVDSVVGHGMATERLVNFKMGTRLSEELCNGSILEKYMESDAEQRKLMETRYGEKILKKLLEGYTLDPQPETISEKQRRYMSSEKQRRYREDRQNEIAARKYIRENTVPHPHTISIWLRIDVMSEMHPRLRKKRRMQ